MGYHHFLWPDTAVMSEVSSDEVAPQPFQVKISCPLEHPGPWILTPGLANGLSDFMPGTLSIQMWSCTFSPRLHGVSLRTLFRCFERAPGPSLLLVRDTDGQVFGG